MAQKPPPQARHLAARANDPHFSPLSRIAEQRFAIVSRMLGLSGERLTLEYTTARDTRFFDERKRTHTHTHTDVHMFRRHGMATTDSDTRGASLAF